jgi:hypothetical protein
MLIQRTPFTHAVIAIIIIIIISVSSTVTAKKRSSQHTHILHIAHDAAIMLIAFCFAFLHGPASLLHLDGPASWPTCAIDERRLQALASASMPVIPMELTDGSDEEPLGQVCCPKLIYSVRD